MQTLAELIKYLSTLSMPDLITALKSLLGAFTFDIFFLPFI